MANGFLVGRKMNMYPIEAAIVNACHRGLGGTGDVATRIGGAITATLTWWRW